MARDWFRARSQKALGFALSEIRKSAETSQSEAAELTQSSRATISRMERGLPVSSATIMDLLEHTAYEILLVPRGARVRIEERS
jgi:HTH-type transcriptional regulator / antitoxin HipB